MTPDFSQFKAQSLSRPMDAAWSNGFAVFEKKGDKVEGILRDVFFKKAEGMFKEQRGFTLELSDGKLKNVSIKREPYFAIRATNDVKLGDFLSIELTELRPSKSTGFKPAKIFAFTSGTLDENAGNATVKELEAKDMAAEGVADTSQEENRADTPDAEAAPF